MEPRLRRTHPTPHFHRLGSTLTTLLYAFLLSSGARLKSLVSAQSDCTGERTEPIRVEDADGVDTLRSAVNCTAGGTVQVDWADRVPVDAPIVVAEGTFLSVTGEGGLAEVYASSVTRLFDVAEGGALTLTDIKLSGGSAVEGGAISTSQAELTLSNCTFEGNAATTDSGGAVSATGGNVTIVGGEFLQNTAIRYGGAVSTNGATLVVGGRASFDGNEAELGSALYCGGSSSVGVLCALHDAVFTSNNAVKGTTSEQEKECATGGGGAVGFLYATVNITDSVFSGNSARIKGGALYGGEETSIEVNGCTFENNTSPLCGGAIAASSITLGGGTVIRNNAVSKSGGGVYGWDVLGTITFNDVTCSDNSAVSEGGCYYAAGESVINNGTVMHDNSALDGGCILSANGGKMRVNGGDFMCRVEERGGFLYVKGNSLVNITGGFFTNNLATRRGGVVYCSGGEDDSEGVGSKLNIEGGEFVNNTGLEVGGAISAWGSSTVVNITGGFFSNNTATFYGGFIFLEEAASLTCKEATITNNYADDQGGGIYAREATWVNSSCDVIASESPQGAAIYLTNVMSATFENHRVADNLASGGSVVFVAASSVVARNVTFESGIGLQEDSTNRAIQLDGHSTLAAKGCVFDGWLGDTVIRHTNSADRSLVLDSCDFSESAAAMAVISPNSDAEIRNAVVGDRMIASAVASSTLNTSLTLVDRALDCSDSNACTEGGCVNSALGVLCECLEDGECLNDGGELSLSLKTPPANVTFSPDTVLYDLLVSSTEDGTTNAIWALKHDGGDLALRVVPSSGVLPPGGNVTVSVTGTPSMSDLGGGMTGSFVLTSAGTTDSSDSADGVTLEVNSMFYLCRAYEYAKPLGGEDDDGRGVSCEQCANIEAAEGVDCDNPGATLASLPIKEGFWRESRESWVIHECLHEDACGGATKVSSSDDYCRDGYKGPYCAVCSEGYGRGVSTTCHRCDDTKARLLISAGALFSLALLVLLALAVIFLVGGLDAVDSVRQSVGRKLSRGKRSTSRRWRFTPEASLRGRPLPRLGAKIDSLDTTVAPAYDFEVEDSRRAAVGADSSHRTSHRQWSTSNHRRVSPSIGSEPDHEVRAGFDESAMPDHGVGGGVDAPDFTGREARARVDAPGTPGGYATGDVGVSAHGHARRSAVPDTGTGARGGVAEGAGVDGEAAVGGVEAEEGGKKKCCGFGDKVKRLLSRLPLDKLKILVVVWQILTVFSSITGVEFPATYAAFLSWINVVNLDIGNIFSASCLLPTTNFYVRLLVTTLAPLVLATALVITYHLAKSRAGIGRAGVIARRAAWSRHVAAWLLLTFLVFTSASTAAFKTFACDHDAVDGESYLRADYSISCKSRMHMFFRVYAGLMILVYPIGIPALYASILWKNRELLNPCIPTSTKPGPDAPGEVATRADSLRDDDNPRVTLSTASKRQTRNGYSSQELRELEELVKARRENPQLVPSMFLWKDFGPDLYYYEVIECGRRMLLTGVLIFIAPQSPTQTSMACIFAFASLLGFELMRPHLDPADSWLYRMGCVVIFLSNFLALLIKVDAAGEENRAAFGGVLVLVNMLLVLAVLVTSWFATQQSVDDSREEETSFTLAKTMLTAEQYAADSARLTRERGRGALPSTSSPVRPYIPPSSDSAAGELGAPPSRKLQRGGAISEDVIPTYERAGGGLFAPPSRRMHRRVATSDDVVPTHEHTGRGLFAPPARSLQRSDATSEDAILTNERTAGGLLTPAPRRGGASGMAISEDAAPSYERATRGLGVPPSRRPHLGGPSGVSTGEDAVPTYERSAGGLFAPPPHRLQRGGVTSEDVIPTYERVTGGLFAPPSCTLQRGGARSEDVRPTYERKRAAGILGEPPSRGLQLGSAFGVNASEDAMPTYDRATGGLFALPSRGLQRGGAVSEDVIPTYDRAAGGLGAPPSRRLQRSGATGTAAIEDALPNYARAAELGELPSRRLQRGGAFGAATSEDFLPAYEREAGHVEAATEERLPQRSNTREGAWRG